MLTQLVTVTPPWAHMLAAWCLVTEGMPCSVPVFRKYRLDMVGMRCKALATHGRC